LRGNSMPGQLASTSSAMAKRGKRMAKNIWNQTGDCDVIETHCQGGDEYCSNTIKSFATVWPFDFL
jgi:hypothetical protein